MRKTRLQASAASHIEQKTGKIARRAFLGTSAKLLLGAGVAAGALQSAKAMQKLEQSAVDYQDTPMDGQSCANCTFYDGDVGCSIVEGEVSADGWCNAWFSS